MAERKCCREVPRKQTNPMRGRGGNVTKLDRSSDRERHSTMAPPQYIAL